jgi:hypothetical protein
MTDDDSNGFDLIRITGAGEDADEAELNGATASGIAHCLHMLADEAATLQLGRTLRAIRRAIEICSAEGALDIPEDIPLAAPAGVMLH